MITQKPNTVKKMVTILTEGEASFVSLVKQPANRTPFAVLKSEDVSEIQTENDMSDTKDTALIHKFEFAKEQFENEEAVRKHMDSHGYEGYSVEDEEKSFVVKGVDESAFEKIEPISDTVDGLTMYVGTKKSVVSESEDPEEIKKDDEGSEEEESSEEVVEKGEDTSEEDPENPESVEKGEEGSEEEVEEVTKGEEEESPESVLKTESFDGAEVVKKYDYWYASGGNETLADELADGNSGRPLGYYSAQEALSEVIYTLTKSGETEKIPAACAEFGVLVQKLAELTQGKESVMKAAFAKDVKSLEIPVEVVVKSEEEKEPQFVFKTEEEFNAAVEAVVKSALEPVQESVQKSSDRLASLEKLKVSRKSAPAPEDTQEAKEPVEKSETPFLRDTLGVLPS